MDAPRSPSDSIAVHTWIAGILIALFLHAGVVAATFIQSPEEEPDDDAAGVSIPIDMVSVAYAAPSEVAPRIGPQQADVAAQVANQAKEQPKAEEAQKSDNRDPPPENQSEVALPKPATEDTKQEEKTEKKQKTEQEQVSQTIAPQEAAAMSTVSAPPTPQARALSPGISPSQLRSKQSWQKALVTQIDKFKRYPAQARRDHETGDVIVMFVMDRKGDVLSSTVVQSSGSQLLDQEGLEVLQRAKPLPIPPDDFTGDTFQLKVPIRFRIKE